LNKTTFKKGCTKEKWSKNNNLYKRLYQNKTTFNFSYK